MPVSQIYFPLIPKKRTDSGVGEKREAIFGSAIPYLLIAPRHD
jgi:hypothetical protein